MSDKTFSVVVRGEEIIYLPCGITDIYYLFICFNNIASTLCSVIFIDVISFTKPTALINKCGEFWRLEPTIDTPHQLEPPTSPVELRIPCNRSVILPLSLTRE